MRANALRVACAAVVLLAVTGCRPVMLAHFSDAKSPGALEQSDHLDELAAAHSQAMCAAGEVLRTPDPLAVYGGPDGLAVVELVGVTPLDPGITSDRQRLISATDAVWAQWQDDPAVTDPAYNVLGVGFAKCGSNLYYTAILVDLPGPWPTERVVLPTLGGSFASAEGVSESGFVVGASTLPADDAFHAYRWAWPDEAPTDLGTLGGTDSVAYDVNEGGTVVGSSSLDDDHVHAFVAEPGDEMESLGTLGGTQSVAHAVNNAGVVVGSSMLPGDEASTAFRWDPETGEMEALPGLSTRYSAAHDVNDAGLVVGETLLDDGRMVAFVWSPTSGTRILDDDVTVSGLLDVNERGTAVGSVSQGESFDYQPGLWFPGHGDGLLQATIGLGGDATAYASNEESIVVGQSGVTPTEWSSVDPEDIGVQVGFVRTRTGKVLTPEGTSTNSIFTDVSRELAVGTVVIADGQSRAVVHPLAALSPSTAGLIASVPSGAAAVAVSSPIAMAALVLARRRLRGAGADRLGLRARWDRRAAFGLAGTLVVGLVTVAGPLLPRAGAQAAPCAAEQEVLDNQRAYLADMKAALAAGPTQNEVDTAHNIKDAAFDRLHGETHHRNAIQARATELESNVNNWHGAWGQGTSTQDAWMGPLKELFAEEAESRAIENLQLAAETLVNGLPDEVPARALPRGIIQGGVQVSAKFITVGGVLTGGVVAEGVAVAEAGAQVIDAGVGLMVGTAVLVQGVGLYEDIRQHPPATLDQIAQLSTVYNQNLDHWAEVSVERSGNEARVEQAKTLVQDALGLLNGCREENGLGPVTLPADELPGDEPQAGANGEPHLVTFDGLTYDFQAEGEFWMVRSAIDDFGIQIRTTHGTPASAPFWDPGRVAWIDGVAVATPGGHSVVHEPGQVLIDGTAPVALPTVLDDGTFVQRVNDFRVEVILADGTLVSAFFPRPGQYAWWSGVNVTLADARRGAVGGLLGDADGSPVGDGKAAAGDVLFGPGTLAGPGANDLLYGEFGPSWLVGPDERMLPGDARAYRAPEAFPSGGLSFPQADIDAVRDQCVVAGIAVAPALDWCVFDALITGVHPEDVDPELTTAWADTIVRDGLGVQASGEPIETVDAGNTPAVEPVTGAGPSVGLQLVCGVVVGEARCWSSFGHFVLTGIPDAVVDVTAGDLSWCARTISGDLWCSDRQIAVDRGLLVTEISEPVAQVDAGVDHTCAVTASGVAWCWGSNTQGQLGDGTTTESTTPVAVVGLPEPVAQISAGDRHTCAATVSGEAWCWGLNNTSQLGDGTTTTRLTPVAVVGVPEPVVEIDTQGGHTCVRTGSGAAWCWGSGTSGQLGNGGLFFSSPTPVAVTGLAEPIAQIDTGYFNTCAVTVSGVALCWGANTYGQLGIGATGPSTSTPAPVTGLPQPVARVDVGAVGTTCARTQGGEFWCWGYNAGGLVGDGTTTNRSTPVKVEPPTP